MRFGARYEARSWRRSHHCGRRGPEQSELAADRAMAPFLVPLVTQAIQQLKCAVAPRLHPFGATAHPVVPPKAMCRQQDGAQVGPPLLSCPTKITPEPSPTSHAQHHREAARYACREGKFARKNTSPERRFSGKNHAPIHRFSLRNRSAGTKIFSCSLAGFRCLLGGLTHQSPDVFALRLQRGRKHMCVQMPVYPPHQLRRYKRHPQKRHSGFS